MDINLEAAMKRIAIHGPDRVLINPDEGVPCKRAKEMHGVTPDVVFIRKDGWSLGAPARLKQAAYKLWADEWVGMMLMGGKTVVELGADNAIIPMSRCPVCAVEHDMATSVEELPRQPVAGDCVVCWECGAINRFDNELRLTTTNVEDLPEEVQFKLKHIQQFIRRNKRERGEA